MQISRKLKSIIQQHLTGYFPSIDKCVEVIQNEIEDTKCKNCIHQGTGRKRNGRFITCNHINNSNMFIVESNDSDFDMDKFNVDIYFNEEFGCKWFE